MSTDAAVEETLRARARLIRDNPIFGFVPNSKQMDFIHHDAVKMKGMVGSNKLGKSTLVVIEAICHSFGCRPFFYREHPHFKVLMPNGEPIRVPNLGQVAAEDYPNGIGQVLWPMFKKWLPKGSWKEGRTEKGLPRSIMVDVSWNPDADKTSPLYPYSEIHFRAYVQGRETFAGIDPDWILDDEPPPQNIWIEQIRGLVPTGGKWMGAMTCVEHKHNWIYEVFFPARARAFKDSELEEAAEKDPVFKQAFRSKSYYIVSGSMYDNLKKTDGSGGLQMQDIQEYADAIDDPVERAVRVEGKPLHLLGTEYGSIWDPDIHIVKHRDPDPECVFVMGVDAHPTKPYGILFFEVNEHDEWYVWAESFDTRLNKLSLIADEIKSIEGWKRNSRGAWIPGSGDFAAQIRLIDPLASTPDKGVGYDAIQQLAVDEDLFFIKWKRGNLANRVRKVKDWLVPGTGPHKRPKLTVSENCRTLIYQIPRYREKMPEHPESQERKGLMMAIDDDLVQPLIAVANANYTFRMLANLKPARPVVAERPKVWWEKAAEAPEYGSVSAGY